MSAHVQQKLWAHARGQLAAEDARAVDAHLATCGECKRVLEQFRAAVVVVKPLEPPVLDDAAWSRIDSKVMAAARKELARGQSPFAWLFDGWRPLLLAGVAAALLVTFLVARTKPVAPVVTPQPEQVAKVEPSPNVEPTPAPVVEAPPPQLLALSNGGHARVGEAIATAAGDRTFVALPDGSRAGGVGDSAFTVDKASPTEVKLTVDRGAMIVAAAHATEGRSFVVKAGEVEVVVVGTRFLVDRAEAVTVVVEEGKVEVAANGQKHVVSAGETLVIDTGGRAQRKKAITPTARAAFKILKVEAPVAVKTTVVPSEVAVADSNPGSSAQRLSDEDTTEPPVEGGNVAAQRDAGTQFGALTPPPLLLPGDQQGVASTAPAKEEKKFDLLGALKRFDLKNVNLDAPYPPVGMPMSEYRVHQLQRNADRGQCDRVVERADAWMTEFSADPNVKNRSVLAKAVLFTKARCLTKLGRTAEAEKVRAAAEAVK